MSFAIHVIRPTGIACPFQLLAAVVLDRKHVPFQAVRRLSRIETLSRQVLEQPLDLDALARDLSARVVQVRRAHQSQYRRLLAKEAELDAKPAPQNDAQRTLWELLPHIKAGFQDRARALSIDVPFAIGLETRADMVRRLAAVVGPTARMSDLSRLLALAANADEAAQATSLIREEIVKRTSALLIAEFPTGGLDMSRMPEEAGMKHEEDEWVNLRNGVADRVLDDLGIPRESSAGDVP